MNTSDNRALIEQTIRRADSIVRQVDEGCDSIRQDMKTTSEAFYRTVVGKIPQWVNSHVCKNTMDSIFSIKSDAKAMTEELMDVISDNLTEEAKRWSENTFVPMLENEVETLAQAVSLDLEGCLKDLDQVRMNINVDSEGIVDDTTPSSANRLLSSGGSLLFGDLAGAIMGGLAGFSGTLKTITCEITAGIILGIVALFNPVSMTAVVIAVIISSLIGGAWALSDMEDKIKKTVIEKATASLRSGSSAMGFGNMVDDEVEKYLDKIRERAAGICTEIKGRAAGYRAAIA